MSTPFKHRIGQRLALAVSGEVGEAIARSEHATTEPQYLIRYRAADGRAVEAWWGQSAVEAVDGTSAFPPVDVIDPGAWLIAPRIGAFWAGRGGIYAGISRGADGAPDHHLILCPTEPLPDPVLLAWQPAMDWAAALRIDDFSDWSLPTRGESALLFANVRDLFEPAWHWTSEQYSRYDAWGQLFDDGIQTNNDKSFEGRARAVRRLVIQPFNPS